MGLNKSGTSGARVESAQLIPDYKLRFRRAECPTCKEEKIFRGVKCTTCGTMLAEFVKPKGRGIDYGRKQTSFKRQLFKQQIYQDRRAYWDQKAAESRAKWEGKK